MKLDMTYNLVLSEVFELVHFDLALDDPDNLIIVMMHILVQRSEA